MGNFDFEKSRIRIEEILNSKTDIEEVYSISNDEDGFTYENGVRTWIGAMFIDIRNSTDYFKDNNAEKVARVMRAFASEIIEILRQNEKYIQIGIRGDCVYAIYSAPAQQDLQAIMCDACLVNTFHEMFQEILKKKGWPTFEIGIGLGASKDLVIKAGRKGTGINDNIWIGDAVIDASKLSNEGSTSGIEPIVMDCCFYDNIKDFYANDTNKYSNFIHRVWSSKLSEHVYCCDMVTRYF